MSDARQETRKIIPGAHLRRAAEMVAQKRVCATVAETRPAVIEVDNDLYCRLHDNKNDEIRIFLAVGVAHKRLAQTFYEYLIKNYMDQGKATHGRETIRKEGSSYAVLSEFLTLEYPNNKSISIDKLPTSIMFDLERWLIAYRFTNADGDDQSLSPNSIGIRYNKIRKFFRWCRSQSEYAFPDTIDLSRKIAPGRHHKTEHRESIALTDLSDVRLNCIKEIRRVIRRRKIGEMIKMDANIKIPDRSAKMSAYRRKAIAVKLLYDEYGSVLPSLVELRETRPGFERALRHYYKWDDIVQYLHFTSAMMVPFVIMIAMDTFFNPVTILRLRWSDVERSHSFFGERRWVLKGVKGRANQKQSRSFAASLKDLSSPVRLLKILEKYNDTVYQRQRLMDSDYVFAYETPYHNDTTFVSDKTDGMGNWKKGLKKFCERTSSPLFQLSKLRASGAEISYYLTGGDLIAVRDMLNHSSINTTYNHYHTETSRKVAQGMLATAMEDRQRYLESGGRLDPRNSSRSGRLLTAATPGFNCLEPEFSPVVGQEEGKKCSAYGMCPACPLSWVSLRDPTSFAILDNLRDLISQARTEVAPQRWLAVWAPQLAAIHEWIEKFPAQVREASEGVIVRPLAAVE